MKTVQAIASDINSCILATPTQFAVSALIAAGPTAMAAAQKYFRYALVYGYKDENGTLNAQPVKIGVKSGTSQQPITINPGDCYILAAPIGAKWDFQQWFYAVAADNDGLVVIYS